MIAAPVLYMVKEGMKEKLEQFVKNGGTLITTFMSGIVDQSDNVHLGGYPGPLREMAGVWVEEIDALAPEHSNTVSFSDGKEYKCNLLCDLMHSEGAEVLATYESDFYAGMPAVTKTATEKAMYTMLPHSLRQPDLQGCLMKPQMKCLYQVSLLKRQVLKSHAARAKILAFTL